ncbi:sigma-70 family RNA polymerase sigma factor [Catenulispora sp. GAS73]|uniref:sigma-70 family RNA polymerase sigma factor n=1 Tax=Catenulispora sp. GAS73 TaxID=3156269 RepID=UPI003514DEE1
MKFEVFFRAEMPRVIHYLMLTGACFEEASDAAQTAFAAMWPRWDQIKAPKAYVRVAARNAYLRTTVGEYSATRPVPIPEWFDQEEQLPQLCAAEFSEQESAVVALIAALPTMQRLVMAWTFDGFSPAEIADVLGVDTGTVRQNLFKARKKLKQQLIENGGGS